ncbi:MAG: hypothetical protein JO180_07480 [Gemmatirosa sp.]|nr:hypothetical protein [Gemmatirosa sp.]
MIRSALPLRLAALLCPVALAAQVSTADEGSFTVTRQGARIGREEFRIVKQPVAGGVEYVARGLTAYGDRRVTAALQTNATGAPLRYQVDVKNGSDTEARLTGTIVHGRFSAQIKTARGEAASEFAAGDGAVLLDDEIYHQYFFLGLGGRLAGGASSVPVVVPRKNSEGTAQLRQGGSEPVTIGGQSVPATRLVISWPGSPERNVWVDATGRVLKVTLPALGVVALRDDPPPAR